LNAGSDAYKYFTIWGTHPVIFVWHSFFRQRFTNFGLVSNWRPSFLYLWSSLVLPSLDPKIWGVCVFVFYSMKLVCCVELRTKSRTLNMLDKCSITKLYPQPWIEFLMAIRWVLFYTFSQSLSFHCEFNLLYIRLILVRTYSWLTCYFSGCFVYAFLPLQFGFW
jgi:hypothetical protein